MSQYSAHRRSLQPPQMVVQEDDEGSGLVEKEGLDSGFSAWTMPTNKRASMYASTNGSNGSNQSLNIPKRQHHRRQSSMAAETYTPQQVGPLPPSTTPNSATASAASAANINSPFKFGSLNVSSESLNVPKTNYRRGHRYKHSSVSMNLFQEAPEAVVKNVPESHPVPSVGEVWGSVTGEQMFKWCVCMCQLFVLGGTYVLGLRLKWGCLVTLAHVLFYDLIANALTLGVQVLGNFAVWKQSSLAHPFGLGRIEVLASFGLSVSLLFVGLDLASHVLEEIVGEVIGGDPHGETESHHGHASSQGDAALPTQINTMLYEMLMVGIVAVSLFTSHTVNSVGGPGHQQEPGVVKRLSSITLNAPSHKPLLARILNAMGFSTDDARGARNMMSSSTTLATLIYAAYCMVYPVASSEWLDRLSTAGLSLLVLWLGYVLIKRYSYTLLLGSQFQTPGPLEDIRTMVASLDCYRSSYTIANVSVARVNPKLWVVILEVAMPGASDDEEAKLRFYASRVITGVMSRAVNAERVTATPNPRGELLDIMAVPEGNSNVQFEITVDVSRS